MADAILKPSLAGELRAFALSCSAFDVGLDRPIGIQLTKRSYCSYLTKRSYCLYTKLGKLRRVLGFGLGGQLDKNKSVIPWTDLVLCELLGEDSGRFNKCGNRA